ncbi:unnamed protein product [Oppiella nova]|uniref:Uncharacterized protein n=1 Tax=Oppiella nova TaxID=334625 RepID=A0A7R9MA28_9ACAR|nr:unnamed protein product [Oppiella nova]CAG2173554.1 unnamed protein product [Oppiella nova]
MSGRRATPKGKPTVVNSVLRASLSRHRKSMDLFKACLYYIEGLMQADYQALAGVGACMRAFMTGRQIPISEASGPPTTETAIYSAIILTAHVLDTIVKPGDGLLNAYSGPDVTALREAIAAYKAYLEANPPAFPGAAQPPNHSMAT